MTRSSDPRVLIAEYGKSIGAEGLAFNDRDELRIYIDDDIVDLRFDKEKKILVLASVLSTALVEKTSDLYLNVLELNLVGILSGGGSVGFNRAENKLVYGDSLLLNETDSTDFNNFIGSSIALIRAWKKLLSSGDLLKKQEAKR